MSNWGKDKIYLLRDVFRIYADEMFESSINREPLLIEPHHCNIHSYVEGFIEDMLDEELKKITDILEGANSTPTIRE